MKNVLEQALEVIEAYCSGRLGAASTITALKEAIANDTMKKQWQREALLEAADNFVKNNQVDADGGWAVEELRRMAEEME